jgi:pyridoxal 5'-phosphate synthase pdxT subunit
MPMSRPVVGILCLQGDFEAHGHVLEALGASWRDVRRGRDLLGLHGLLLPGGESTTMWHFLRQDGLLDSLRDLQRRGAALYGTCAGAILLAREVRNPDSAGLAALDITIERNSYGRQMESSVQAAIYEDVSGLGDPPPAGSPLEAVLIRAPRILRVGAAVRVRARLGTDPVWVEAGPAMATTFHPELGADTLPHRRFLELSLRVATGVTLAGGGR